VSAETWILAEQGGRHIRPVSYELLAWGRRLADKLGGALAAVALGDRLERTELEGLISRGADHVYVAEEPVLAHFLVEPYAAVLEDLIRRKRPEIFLAAATTLGRTLMPYLAVRLHTGLTADCTHLDVEENTGHLLQIRPAIGGNVMATIRTPVHRPQMATVRPHTIAPAIPVAGRCGQIIPVTVRPEVLRSRTERLGFRPVAQDEGDIQAARIVVSGGRGLKRPENFRLVRALAAVLGGAVGASREAVDRGWISYPHQVGLSGRTVTPEWYFAIGISGAIQHLAGMKTAEHIVAINSDPQAQIFQVCDFGVVGDLFEVVPALIEELKRRQCG